MTEPIDPVAILFHTVRMPERFVLEVLTADGSWIDWGLFRADGFERHDDGAYLNAAGGGSPMWIRCLRQDGNVVYVLDGAGDPFVYRLVTFPGGGYHET